MLNLNPLRDRLGPDFRPFAIRLSDGRSFNIPHRDFVAVGRGVVVVLDEDDHTYMIDPLHIVSIDGQTSEPSNGV